MRQLEESASGTFSPTHDAQLSGPTACGCSINCGGIHQIAGAIEEDVNETRQRPWGGARIMR
jgi:hypothetical protein